MSHNPHAENYYNRMNKRGMIEHDPKIIHSTEHGPLNVPHTNEVGRFAHVCKMKQQMFVLNCSPKSKKRRGQAPASDLGNQSVDMHTKQEEEEYTMGVYQFVPSGSLEVGFPDNVEPHSKFDEDMAPSPSSLYNIVMEEGTQDLLKSANPIPISNKAIASSRVAAKSGGSTFSWRSKQGHIAHV